MQERYDSLDIAERIELLKETTRNKVIGNHTKLSEDKSLHLKRNIKDLSEGQQSIAITAFSRIRDT